ncbi:MAG: hypothetical protein ABW088_13815 [Sedimenticola sp.]
MPNKSTKTLAYAATALITCFLYYSVEPVFASTQLCVENRFAKDCTFTPKVWCPNDRIMVNNNQKWRDSTYMMMWKAVIEDTPDHVQLDGKWDFALLTLMGWGGNFHLECVKRDGSAVLSLGTTKTSKLPDKVKQFSHKNMLMVDFSCTAISKDGKASAICSAYPKKQNPLIYGKRYHIRNWYDCKSEGGGYLDTRGNGCEENELCVSTSSNRNRDAGSGIWKILPFDEESSLIGYPVRFGDRIILENQYGDKSYLDTRGNGCEDNKLCVSTSSNSNRDAGSGGWSLWPPNNDNGTDYPHRILYEKEPLNIENQYGDGSWLDTRGDGCEGNKLCVSSSSSRNRDGGSGKWSFIHKRRLSWCD